MLHRRSESSAGQRGFTLAEILVTTAIFAIIMIAALAVYDQSNKVFKTSTESADMQQSTRIGFDKLVSDMRMAGFDYNRGGQPQETWQWPQPDEQIEYAGPTAVVFRANFNYNTAASTGNGLEPAYTPTNQSGQAIFPYVTTSNSEIVAYVLRSNNAGQNNSSLSFWVDDYRPRAAFLPTISPAPAPGSPAHPEATVTINGIDTTNANPPYTLYRVTLGDSSACDAGNCTLTVGNAGIGTPVAENIRSIYFQYYSDTKGTTLLQNPDLSAISTGRNAGGGTFCASISCGWPMDTGAIGGDGQYDPTNSATNNVADRTQRGLIQAVRVALTGMNASPDLQGYTNPTETIAAIKNYRQYALSSLVVPRNLGKTGFPEPTYNPPGPPTITGICVGYCGAPVVYWQPPSVGGPVVQYRVQWDLNANGAFPDTQTVTISDASATSTTFQDDGASDVSQTRYYRIIAINDNGASIPSAVFPAVPQNTTQPSPVSNLQAVGGTRSIALTWTSPTTDVAPLNTLSCSGTGGSTVGSQIPPQEIFGYQIWRGENPDFNPNAPPGPGVDNGVKVLDFPWVTPIAGTQPSAALPGATVTWVDSPTTSAYPPASCKQYYYRVRIADRCAANPNWNNPNIAANSISDFFPPLGSPAIPAGGAQGASSVVPNPPVIRLSSTPNDVGCPDPQGVYPSNCRITLKWPKVTTDTAGNAIAVDTYRITRNTQVQGSGNAWGLDNNFGSNGQLIVNCSTGTCSSGSYTQTAGTNSYVDFPPWRNGNGQTLAYQYTVAALGCPTAVSSPTPQPNDPYSAESNQVAYPGCTMQVAVSQSGSIAGDGQTPGTAWVLNAGDFIQVSSVSGPSIASVNFQVTMWPSGTPVAGLGGTVNVAPFRMSWSDQTDGQIYTVQMLITDTTGCQETLVRYVEDQPAAACAIANQPAPSATLATAGTTVTDSETLLIPVSGSDPVTVGGHNFTLTWDRPAGDTNHADLKLVSLTWSSGAFSTTDNLTTPVTAASPGPTVTVRTIPAGMPVVNPGSSFSVTIHWQYRKQDDPPALAGTVTHKACVEYTIPSEPGVIKHCNVVGQSATTANPNACD